MTPSEPQVRDAPLDLREIARIVRAELADFEEDFEVDPTPLAQDLRAGFVAWIAVFLPEAFSEDAREALRAFVVDARMRSDFEESLWWRTPYLDAALYALTGSRPWLDPLLGGLASPSSALRRGLQDGLALVADRIAFPDPMILERTERNLAAAHFFNEGLFAVVLAMPGDAEAKRETLRRWLEGAARSPQDKETLGALVRGEWASNERVAGELHRLARYGLARLAALRPGEPGPAQGSLFAPRPTSPVGVRELFARMDRHPMGRSSVRVKVA